MRVAIIQSNYLPWKGYFDIIHDVDLFVFLDDAQFTTRDWRNRNQIKTAHGPLWLTVPVRAGSREKAVSEVEIGEPGWGQTHWKSLEFHYKKAPHFGRYSDFFAEALCEREWTHLSELNRYLIEHISRDVLGISTRFLPSMELSPQGQRQERLLDILTKVGATSYVSGPTASAYMDPSAFEAAGIELLYKDYVGYPAYAQFHPPFTHHVSIVDLLFHTGPEAAQHIWGWREALTRTALVPQAADSAVEGPAVEVGR